MRNKILVEILLALILILLLHTATFVTEKWLQNVIEVEYIVACCIAGFYIAETERKNFLKI
ncbi:MAG: hypothetical protein GX638_03060 [Crenarchaeota archaeon]|nr:hypothetical protein [Thermoproteota archaeon]